MVPPQRRRAAPALRPDKCTPVTIKRTAADACLSPAVKALSGLGLNGHVMAMCVGITRSADAGGTGHDQALRRGFRADRLRAAISGLASSPHEPGHDGVRSARSDRGSAPRAGMPSARSIETAAFAPASPPHRTRSARRRSWAGYRTDFARTIRISELQAGSRVRPVRPRPEGCGLPYSELTEKARREAGLFSCGVASSLSASRARRRSGRRSPPPPPSPATPGACGP